MEREFVNPQPKHQTDAIKLGLSVQAIRRTMDPRLHTERRHLTQSLAHRLANPKLPLREIVRNSNLELDLLEGDLKLAFEAFQWAATVCSVDNNPEQQGVD